MLHKIQPILGIAYGTALFEFTSYFSLVIMEPSGRASSISLPRIASIFGVSWSGIFTEYRRHPLDFHCHYQKPELFVAGKTFLDTCVKKN